MMPRELEDGAINPIEDKASRGIDMPKGEHLVNPTEKPFGERWMQASTGGKENFPTDKSFQAKTPQRENVPSLPLSNQKETSGKQLIPTEKKLDVRGEAALNHLQATIDLHLPTDHWHSYLFTDSPNKINLMQKEIHDHLQTLPEEDQRPQRIFKPSTPDELKDIIQTIEKEVETGEPALRWIEGIHSTEEWKNAWSAALVSFNRRRDSAINRLQGGLIIAAPSDVQTEAFRMDDMFSMRSGADSLDE